MENKLYHGKEDKEICYGIGNYNECADFDEMVRILKEEIGCDELDYGWGWDDANGYFIKDGIKVEIMLDTYLYLFWIYKGTKTPEISKKIHDWAETVFEGLKKFHGEG